MKRIEYRTFDKSGWGPGPWQDEPDKIQWPDAATGLPCMIRRNLFGIWCGYVGVPDGHPWFGVHRDDIEAAVHGGISFTAPCLTDGDEATDICHVPDPGEPDQVWWVGFDCNHAWDFAPAMATTMTAIPDVLRGLGQSGFRTFIFSDCEYRDLAFVEAECADLASQAAEAAKP